MKHESFLSEYRIDDTSHSTLVPNTVSPSKAAAKRQR
jgi:hypothetical protein